MTIIIKINKNIIYYIYIIFYIKINKINNNKYKNKIKENIN